MPSLLLYLFIASLSMHACSGRFLGIELDNRITKEFIFSEVSRQLLEPLGNHQAGGEGLLRNTRVLPRKLVAQETKGRSLHGSASDDTEEAVIPGERDSPEDAVVMDYEQPHRKPPIHNENF